MVEHQKILTRIINLGQEMTQVKDVDILLEKILTEARHFINADAGSIFVKRDDTLLFNFAQNDTLQKKLQTGKKLLYSSFSLPINNKSIAGYVANTGSTLNLTDVYNIDVELPFAFDKTYDEKTQYTTRSMLAFPLITPRNEVLGVLQIINALDKQGNIIPFPQDDETYIKHFANSAAVALERAKMTRAIILRMLRMAEMRDPNETGPHANRVGAYSALLYEAWASNRGIATSEIEKSKDILRLAAMLHDVGKVAISDVILKKPSRLDQNEYETMKQHTVLGAKLFEDPGSELDEAAYHIALEHHERWDGAGYPGHIEVNSGNSEHYRQGQKKNEEIHPFGRVVAIADVYDALSSPRCYKQAWEESTILTTIKKEAGRQFDPEMVETFLNIFDLIKEISKKYPDADHG